MVRTRHLLAIAAADSDARGAAGAPGRSAIARARPALRERIGRHPRLVPLLAAAPHIGRRQIVARSTAACIEGFPRSANGTAVVAFIRANRGLRLGHHVHATGQLLRAIRFDVPRVLLVRDPLDAVASLLVATGQGPGAGPAQALAAYAGFHRTLMPHLAEIPVCRFEEVVADPGSPTQALNERFGAGFTVLESTPATRRQISERLIARPLQRDRGGVPAAPTEARREATERAREGVAEHPRLGEARSAYDEVLAGAGLRGSNEWR